MDDVRIGERVLVADPHTGATSWSRVVAFSHVERNTSAEFVSVRAASGETLVLSKEHLVFVVRGVGAAVIDVQAQDVRMGEDEILVVPETPGARLRRERVVDVRAVPVRGLFNPQTETGTVVVNGVLASCYVHKRHDVVHALVKPLLWYYAAFGTQQPDGEIPTLNGVAPYHAALIDAFRGVQLVMGKNWLRAGAGVDAIRGDVLVVAVFVVTAGGVGRVAWRK